MTVSVYCLTYNHANFIAQTLDGFLMQETNFDVEYIIADDCSPDNTEVVVKDFISRHPDGYKIKYTKHKENKGPQKNFLWAYNQCKGKYIAICEGDDYWIDPLKLQKQVDFLEKNKDFSLCFTKSYELENGNMKSLPLPVEKKDEIYDFDDFLKYGNFINTASVVFKNENINFPDWFWKSPFGDTALYFILSQHGKIKRLPDITSVYRLHNGGTWSTKNIIEKLEGRITFFKLIFRYLTKEQKKIVRQKAKNLFGAINYHKGTNKLINKIVAHIKPYLYFY